MEEINTLPYKLVLSSARFCVGAVYIILFLLNSCNICRIFAAKLQMVGEYFGRRFLSSIASLTPLDTGCVTDSQAEGNHS